MELDDQLCYCFHVSQRKILNYIRVHQPRRASQLSECGGAGTGCGWCVPYLKKLFEQRDQGISAVGLTPEEYAAQRGAYLQAGKGKPPPGAD
ncbi:MAG: (2Fe-2S)-binding protein [Planctomycetales bacterium]